MTIQKAYKNETFLMSPEARTVRILCEYMEPELRFRTQDIHNTVMFLGSARLRPGPDANGRDYYAEASALAERVAAWTLATHAPAERYYVCTGGGPGIMQAAHEGGARVASALNIGLNISLPFEQHINPYVDDARALEFHYFFMRKFWFVKLARGAVFFPGGFGTLDELFELLTLTQTGKAGPMPILLYGREFWEGLVDFEVLAQRGLISPEDLQLARICDDLDEAFAHLQRELQPHPPEV
ncbi:MAG TPA: LOG family protein [Solimonas sp.]